MSQITQILSKGTMWLGTVKNWSDRMKCTILASAFVAIASAGCGDDVQVHRSVTVMTRNLDAGTDFTPVFGVSDLPAFVAAANFIFQEVLASGVAERAAAVAQEIATMQPDLVSLQEVSMWTSASGTIDVLALLEGALAAAGADYVPAIVVQEANLQAPISLSPVDVVSFVDHDVILVRADEPPAQLQVSNSQSGHFVNSLELPTPFGTVAVPRGWASIDATVRGRTVRFVATHLESFSLPIQEAQAQELLAGPADTLLPVILAGDLNSGPGAPLPPGRTTYDAIVNAGWVDTWSATKPGVDGFTYPLHAEDPYGPATPYQRIDLVLAKGNLKPASDFQTGTEMVGGYWPSDHAGVVATSRIP